MKNQYIGDINDFRKYGLLRILSREGKLKIGVCWMLTDSDASRDGNALGYLAKPQRWKMFDPALFDALKAAVILDKERTVGRIKNAQILPRAKFYPQLLQANLGKRDQYFQKVFKVFAGCDLLFFDPDNGLEVKSVPMGRNNSCKYLYWPELKNTYERGHSVLVYQHFPRKDRVQFITQKTQEIMDRTGAAKVIVFRTPRVAFFCLFSLATYRS